jgi:hypothetical protein
MTKIRRNGPCPCGSGSKAKRCCHGSAVRPEIHHLPTELCDGVIPDLQYLGREAFDALFDELLDLPKIDTSLQQRLAILTPDMDRSIRAIQDDDADALKAVLGRVVAEVDAPDRRLDLAHAVLALRDEGRIPCALAAAAVLDLDGERSTLFFSSVAVSFCSSVAESLADLAGVRRTSAGIVMTTRPPSTSGRPRPFCAPQRPRPWRAGAGAPRSR